MHARTRRIDPACRAGGAEVGLRGGRFGGHDHVGGVALAADAVAGFGEQRADRRFGLGVVALAEGRVAHLAVGVDQVVGRPVLVVVGVPGALVVVLDDGVVDAELLDRVGTLDASCSKANSGVSTPTIVEAVACGSFASHAFR